MKFKFSGLMLIIALSVAGTAAFFSIFGLSQLFAGASVAVILMASVLEIGKVVTTTALHRYWKKISTSLKIYLTSGVIILMLITSAGIYGFLSNAYQKTANKLEIHNGEVAILTTKKQSFEGVIIENKKIIETLSTEKNEINKRLNKRVDNIDFTKNTQSKRADVATNEANKQSTQINVKIDDLNSKNLVLLDSVNKYNIKILNLNSTSDVAAEVGPLKYVAELTGAPMGKVVNILILLIISVFDPLAIALILMTNRIFEIEGETPKNPLTSIVQVIKEKNDGVNNELKEEEEIEEPYEEPITEEPFETNESVNEGATEGATEGVNDGVKPNEEPTPPPTPVTPIRPTGNIRVEDIKEVKERNQIQRIGSNKIVRDNNNSRVVFKKN